MFLRGSKNIIQNRSFGVHVGLIYLFESFFCLFSLDQVFSYHVIRFLDNKEDIAKIRKCFAGLWSLDNPEIINQAIEQPELYVMKPQREGGGKLSLKLLPCLLVLLPL